MKQKAEQQIRNKKMDKKVINEPSACQSVSLSFGVPVAIGRGRALKRNIMTKRSIQTNFLILALLLAVTGLQQATAQSTPQQIMNRIYQKYDSLTYITFDIKYVYSTDTVGGKFKRDVIKGTYTMAGKKALYNIGDIQFMQNDSFFISVYPKDQFIAVADPRSRNAGSELPMRAMMDSMVLAYAQHYTIKISSDSDEGTIKFIRADSMVQFDKFVINYDINDYYLNSIRYEFQEPEVINEDDTTGAQPQTVMRKKSLTVKFSNYRADNFSAKNYSENNYIWFEDGECKPVEKYKGFRVFYSRTGIW